MKPAEMLRMSEADLQTSIIELARMRHWLWFHTYDSRRSTPGFPDLVLVRGGRIIFAEIKTDRGQLKPEQAQWLAELTAVSCVRAVVWRPEDWTSGLIEGVLA